MNIDAKAVANLAKSATKALGNTGIAGGAVAKIVDGLKKAFAAEKAAGGLGTSASAISKRIKDLENTIKAGHGNTGFAGDQIAKQINELKALLAVKTGNTGVAGGAIAKHVKELEQAVKAGGSELQTTAQITKKIKDLEAQLKSGTGNTGIGSPAIKQEIAELKEVLKVRAGNTGVAGNVQEAGWAANAGAAATKLDAKKLNNVLATWTFHKGGSLPWGTKKPAGEVLASMVVVKAPKTGTGSSITAYQLAKDPSKVYFMKAGSIAPHYWGPVDMNILPK